MLIFAHRGASSLCPENSMAAFKKAIELGANGIELDVYILKDGTLAVHHDCKLGRCEEVTNLINDYDKKTIKSFSIGKKFSNAFANEKVPYFTEVLDLIKDAKIVLNVEIKVCNNFITDIGDEIYNLLSTYNVQNKSLISSFNHFILCDIAKKHKNLKTAILYDTIPPNLDIVSYCKKFGFKAIHPNFCNLQRKTVDECKNAGIEVNVWTVDKKEDMLKMKEYGVNSIITNRPQDAIKLFSK